MRAWCSATSPRVRSADSHPPMLHRPRRRHRIPRLRPATSRRERMPTAQRSSSEWSRTVSVRRSSARMRRSVRVAIRRRARPIRTTRHPLIRARRNRRRGHVVTPSRRADRGSFADVRHVRDHYLPPDREAFAAAEPSTGRIIVIAPTRAACETIELAVQLHLDTLLQREHGREILELAGAGKGFGIVAGTGTGKTLAIRPIAETILGTEDLRVGVVNREREATPETPTWNVIIVTTGIARRWFQDDDIRATD